MSTTPKTEFQQESVTVVVRRKVKAGHEEQYEERVKKLTIEARDIPGYLGTNIQRPVGANGEYVSVFRCDSLENLEKFESSELRRTFLKEVTPHVEAKAIWERMTGLEFWFSPPPGTVVAQPSYSDGLTP